MNTTNKNILFIFSAQKWYTRNEYVEKLLTNCSGCDVTIISSDKKTYLFRTTEVLWRYLKTDKKKYDLIYVGFLAQILLPLVRSFYRGRVIGDYFVSMYDTMCGDRGYCAKDSLFGRLIYWFEKWTLQLCDYVIVDTEQGRKYLNDIFNFPLNRISVIYAKANDKIFYPREYKKNDIFTIFFYGSGQPLHGIDVILKAAKELEDLSIKFQLIAPIKKNYSSLLQELSLKNIDLIDWVDYQSLPSYIAGADACLGGHFSANEKARRVIAGKTFQFAAMRKAIILGDNSANREIFVNEENCLLVPCNDPLALSLAIKKLMDNNDLRERIAARALEAVRKIKDDLNFLNDQYV